MNTLISFEDSWDIVFCGIFTRSSFVPSRDGRSHTPAEYTPVEQIVPGVRALAGALHRLAY